MSYAVLYNKTEKEYLPTFDEFGAKKKSLADMDFIEHSYGLQMQTFTDQQEAIDFAKKNDGIILIPAEIESKVVEQKTWVTLEQSQSHANAKYATKLKGEK